MGHPDDTGSALSKLVLVLSLWLSVMTVTALPFDVSAHVASGSLMTFEEPGMEWAWQALFTANLIFLGFLIPFAFFHYEADDGQDNRIHRDWCETQAGHSSRQTIYFTASLLGILAIIHIYIHDAEIEFERITQSPSWVVPLEHEMPNLVEISQMSVHCPSLDNYVNDTCKQTNHVWTIPITFPTFLCVFISVLGNVVLSVFGGIGLAALPFDGLNQIRTRTTPMSKLDYLARKEVISMRCNELIASTEELLENLDRSPGIMGWNLKRKNDALFTKLANSYLILHKDAEMLETVRHLRAQSPLKLLMLMAGSILTLFFSSIWIAHLIIFLLSSNDSNQFLDGFLIHTQNWFAGQFPVFSFLTYFVFCLYLEVVTIYGLFTAGVRFMMWRVFPMSVGGTLNNAFLFNAWFVLLSAFPILHLSVRAFPSYARFSNINLFIGSQVNHLQYIKVIYELKAFDYLLVLVGILTTLLLWLSPHSNLKTIDIKIRKLEHEKASLDNELQNQSSTSSLFLSKVGLGNDKQKNFIPRPLTKQSLVVQFPANMEMFAERVREGEAV
jgi:LMBR1 domain-containing protein 1